MLFKSIKLLLCLIITTVTLNAQAVFTTRPNGTDYKWLELTEATGLSHMRAAGEIRHNASTLYEYEHKYASTELVQDFSSSSAPWYGLNGWYSGISAVNNIGITGSDSVVGVDSDSPASIRNFLLLITGLIGIIGLTRNRSNR